MNLIDAYRYLAALHQHRHFGRAAAACHITQPALSNALRALEQTLGACIVRRGRQYEGLTAEGEQVLATAQRVLHEQELLLQQLASRPGQVRGRLVIGSVPTALPIAARFAARLVERQPGLVPQLRSLSSQELETGLESLALDLALGYTERLAGTASARPRLRAWPQYLEHYHLVTCEAQAAPGLRHGAPMRWADAAALPLALLTPEMHNRGILEQVFRGLGLALRPALETNSVLSLLVAVQSGTFAAVLPGALVGTAAGAAGLLARRLVEPELRTPIGFIEAVAARPSRALEAALALAVEPDWLAHAAAHSGPLRAL
ncbi:MAG: LysR family transcriptional regulator [Burkholderiales bacterium]|nr:LysR family transcriptional regulator [Burkholderiales bacterium]